MVWYKYPSGQLIVNSIKMKNRQYFSRLFLQKFTQYHLYAILTLKT